MEGESKADTCASIERERADFAESDLVHLAREVRKANKATLLPPLVREQHVQRGILLKGEKLCGFSAKKKRNGEENVE